MVAAFIWTIIIILVILSLLCFLNGDEDGMAGGCLFIIPVIIFLGLLMIF